MLDKRNKKEWWGLLQNWRVSMSFLKVLLKIALKKIFFHNKTQSSYLLVLTTNSFLNATQAKQNIIFQSIYNCL